MTCCKRNVSENNPDWLQVLDHPYKILVIGGLVSVKTNALLNLVKYQNDDDYNIIHKTYVLNSQMKQNINIFFIQNF